MRYVAVVGSVLWAVLMMGQTRPATGPGGEAGIKPDVADARYGPHERNVLDLYEAKSQKPTPLAVWIHGGGFVEGDKGHLNWILIKQLLDSGISVALINYRYSTQCEPAPFLDSRGPFSFCG